MQAVNRWPAVPVAVASMVTNAGLNCIWLGIMAAVAVGSGQATITLWRGYKDLLSWLMLILTGLLPWGLGTVLQLTAQQSLTPTTAQLILAMNPVLTTRTPCILRSP